MALASPNNIGMLRRLCGAALCAAGDLPGRLFGGEDCLLGDCGP